MGKIDKRRSIGAGGTPDPEPDSTISCLTLKISELEAKVSSLNSQLRSLKSQLKKKPETIINLDILRDLLLQLSQEQTDHPKKPKVSRFSTIKNPIICSSNVLGPRARSRTRPSPKHLKKSDPHIGGISSSSDENHASEDTGSPKHKRRRRVLRTEPDSDENLPEHSDTQLTSESDNEKGVKKEKPKRYKKIKAIAKNDSAAVSKYCGDCDKTFDTIYNFKRHMQAHSEEKPYKCPICHKDFKLNYHVTRHVHTVHKYMEFTTSMVETSGSVGPRDTAKPIDTAEPNDTAESNDTAEPNDTAESNDTAEPNDTAESKDTAEPSSTSSYGSKAKPPVHLTPLETEKNKDFMIKE